MPKIDTKATRKGPARRPAKSARGARGKGPAGETPGQRILSGMKEVLDTLKAGGMPAVEKRFTVRRLKVGAIKPAVVSAAAAAQVRGLMGVSQAVFAAWLGVSPSTVQGWEQGVNPPAGAAARMLAEMTRDPEHWRRRLGEELAAASGK